MSGALSALILLDVNAAEGPGPDALDLDLLLGPFFLELQEPVCVLPAADVALLDLPEGLLGIQCLQVIRAAPKAGPSSPDAKTEGQVPPNRPSPFACNPVRCFQNEQSTMNGRGAGA